MSDARYQPVIDDTKYRDRLDIKFLFHQQIQRCLTYAGTDLYAHHVMSLARLLPAASFHALMQEPDRWETEKIVWVYKAPVGLRLGTPENPLLINNRVPVRRTEEGDIDWSDPNIYSPHPKIRTFTDYEHLFRLIMDEAEARDLLWSTEEFAKVEALKPTKPAVKNPRRRPK